MKPTLILPVYEFRPPSSWMDKWPMRNAEMYRYADGKWVEDDGEYDLAFVCAQVCYMVEPHYQRNIDWSWLTTHWCGYQPKHPGGNAWHHHLKDGETEWGGDWGRDTHPNCIAGRKGMDFACAKHSSASGMHVEFKLGDPVIAVGLLRECDSKRIVTFPDKPLCMYCGHDWLTQAVLPEHTQ